MTQTVSANGTLNPVVLVSVGTQVSGTVRKLYVDFNDKVEEGQPLLELDDALVSAARARARRRRQRAGGARTGAGQRSAHEGAVRAGIRFEAGIRPGAPGAQGGAAQLALAQGAERSRRANLISRHPLAGNGVVVDRIVDLGQTVAASFQTPTLIKIAQDISEMRIDTSFAEADIGLIREGQKARFTVNAFPNRNFTGDVQQIA